ncbi:uncharacterized protein LOC128549195 [Mercenaria mercenaria]|uniref:uncharacterized protein LOC128549195 n=1 Tax=Mercenaria mercenaria TaxID=6596 RepID=UPI00234E8751|nr:uncharacterized protein LOC128549195 [Mercenaria mercenaria]
MLTRFIATRGTPEEIISDNAKQFKLTSDTVRLVWCNVVKSADVQDYVAHSGVKWSFIVEVAPWMGGMYERLVGLVKRSMRKTMGKKKLTFDQMLTVVKEVESIINSRPLVYVWEDLKSSIALIPSHFICLNPKTGIPETKDDEDDPDFNVKENSSDKLLKMWKKGEKLLNVFWKIWREEYLSSLRERSRINIRSPRIQAKNAPKLGYVVLIKDDLPRGQWKLARIKELGLSSDGEIRSAKVTTASGKVFQRPLNLLFPIETSGETVTDDDVQGKYDIDNEQGSSETDNLPDINQRPTRIAATKAREKIQKLL